jgi:hypothetical protein
MNMLESNAGQQCNCLVRQDISISDGQYVGINNTKRYLIVCTVCTDMGRAGKANLFCLW